MDKCQVCKNELGTKMCKKCGKVVCDSCFISHLGVCINCGAKVMR